MTTAQADTHAENTWQDPKTQGTGLVIASAPHEHSKFGGAREEESAEQTQSKARHNQQVIEELEKLWGKKIHSYYLDHAIGVHHEKTELGIIHSIQLDNGETISYLHNEQQDKRYFGYWGPQENFTEQQAKNIICAAMSTGCKNVTLFGPENHKELMWLEAQMQGVKTDFTPKPGSDIWERLAERQNGGPQTGADPAVDAWLSQEIATLKSVSGADAEKAAAVANVLDTIQETFRDGTAQMSRGQQRIFMQTQQQSSWKDALQYYNDHSAVNGDAFSARARAKTQDNTAQEPAGKGFDSKFSGAPRTNHTPSSHAGHENRTSRTAHLKI